jgi:hypothetical protein
MIRVTTSITVHSVAGVLLLATACSHDESAAPLPDAGLVENPAIEAPGFCNDYSPNRNVYFGDLHVHTSFSHDAYSFGTTVATPADALAFAAGHPIMKPGGGQKTLERPLNFAAVTDHSEQIGTTPPGGGSKAVAWHRMQEAAAQAYDQSKACTFTSFVAYEWSGTLNGTWRHRNVIFRNAAVPTLPISSNDANTPDGLFHALQTQCLDAGTGCDVTVIPHNSNYSKGIMFEQTGLTADTAARRAKFEHLAEVFQYKGNSECKRGVESTDPLCEFDQVFDISCTNGHADPHCTAGSYVRNALRSGLKLAQTLGVNPYKYGFGADSDTHAATPGATEEYSFTGHHGTADGDPRDRLDSAFSRMNPGGLFAVWAEQNHRDSIFNALQRRETFATSGTRLKVRFFGGWNYPDTLCNSSNMVSVGYQDGVPMGGDLPTKPSGVSAPKFVVWAAQDPGAPSHPGAPLQMVEVVKGWVDPATGVTNEKVFFVDGDANSTADVNTNTCQRSGTGHQELCKVWTDPEFDKTRPAFYYARVIENPSCKSQAYDCQALTTNKPAICSDPAMLKGQDRAWSSPIWYAP